MGQSTGVNQPGGRGIPSRSPAGDERGDRLSAVRSSVAGGRGSGALFEDDGGAVAAARAPHSGAGERGGAGEVEAVDGGLVLRQLGVRVAERGQRPAGETGGVPGGEMEVALVDVRGHRSPLDDRVEEPRLAEFGERLEPTARFGRIGPASDEAERRVQRFERQDVTARGRDRRVDQRRHVHQQSRAFEDPAVGHHRRPTVDVREARRDRRGRPERPVEAAQHRRRRQHRVDLRFVALVVADVAPASDQICRR